MHFNEAQLIARIRNPRFFVSARRGDAGGMEIAAVPARRLHFPSVRCGTLQGLARDDVLLTPTAGDFGSRQDRPSHAVADAATVEAPERLGAPPHVPHPIRK